MKKIMPPLLFCFLFFCAELQTFAAAVDISSWSYLNDELIDGSDIDLAGDIIYFGSIYTSAASSIRGGNGSASFALNGRKLFNAIVSSSPSKISFEGNIVFTLFNGVSSGGALGAFGYGAGFSFADSLINLNSNAASFGGAVSAFSMSFVKADNSSISFISNTSLNNGGAIYAAQSSSISMSSSKISFEKNAALGRGGAVFISFSTWTLNSVNASFISNRGDIGGGIYGENSLLNFSASNFVFASNMSRNANGMGAALYLENSSADFVNSNAVFNLNYGSRFGSAVYLDNSDINFIRSEIIFSSNNAREGGAIYAKNKSLINMEIQNGARIVFNNNTANRGADIYFSNSRLNINLGAGASAELNGGIYAENLGVFQIYGSGSGGAVYLRGDNYLTGISSFSLKSAALRVENSFVYSSGAAIYADRADLTFNGGSFLFNANSGDFGGVFNIEDSNAVFSGSAAFAGNSAQNGGVFYIKDSNIVFEKSLSFTRNSAQSGGALYLDGSSAVFKGSAAFIQNDAADAVIYARDRSILTFTADAGDIVFSNNNAPVSLYLDGGNNAVIFNAASQNKIEIAGIRTLDGDIIVKNGAGFLIVETDRGFGIQGEFNLNEGFLNIRTRFIDIRVLNMQANSSIKMENPNFIFRSSAGYLNTADAAATLYTDQLSARSASFYFNLYFNGRDIENDIIIATTSINITGDSFVMPSAYGNISEISTNVFRILFKTGTFAINDNLIYGGGQMEWFKTFDDKRTLSYFLSKSLDGKEISLFLSSVQYLNMGGLNRNQNEVRNLLNNIKNSSEIERMRLKINIAELTDIRRYLDEISGVFIVNVLSMDANNNNMGKILNRLSMRRADEDEKEDNFWFQFDAISGGAQGEESQDSGVSISGSEWQLGADFKNNKDNVYGIYLGQSIGSIKQGYDKAGIMSFEGGIYTASFNRFSDVFVNIEGAISLYDSQRQISVADKIAEGSFSNFSARLNAEAEFKPFERAISLRPYIASRGIYIRNSKIQEEGADGFNLLIAPQTYTRLDILAGAKAVLRIFDFELYGKFFGAYIMSGAQAGYDINFADYSSLGMMHIKNREIDNVYYVAGGGASYLLSNYGKLFANVSISANSDIDAAYFTQLGIEISFKQKNKKQDGDAEIEEGRKMPREISSAAVRKEVLPPLQKKPANINAAQSRQRAEQRRSNLQMISFRLPAALFAANSYELSSSARNEIKNIAERIKRYKYKSVIVEGHTDSSGNRESNISLSQDRAIMVYYELYQNGIEVLDYEGFGDSFPIASNDSAEGRELNRRVEIFVEIDNEN